MSEEPVPVKRCSNCWETKPVTEFYPQRARKGYMGYCKLCARKRNKEWRVANHDRIIKQLRKYKRRNRQRVNEWHRNWLQRIYADPEKHAAFLARHRELYKQARQYLPAKRRKKSEQDSFIDGRRLHPNGRLRKIIRKVSAKIEQQQS